MIHIAASNICTSYWHVFLVFSNSPVWKAESKSTLFHFLKKKKYLWGGEGKNAILLCDLTKSLIEQENDIYYLITFDMTELYYHWRKQLGSPIVSLEKKNSRILALCLFKQGTYNKIFSILDQRFLRPFWLVS